MIFIFDASSLIYTGHTGMKNSPFADSLSARIHGTPVAGVRYALKQILKVHIDYPDGKILVVFDPLECDKYKVFPGYKQCRNFDSDIFLQKEMLYEICNKFGFNTYKVENHEADDIIYTICYRICVEKTFLSDYEDIFIYADDLDICQSMLSTRVFRMSLKKGGIVLDSSNFASCAKSGEIIPFNTTAPFIMFNGKPSNNVPSMKDGKKLFKSYALWARDNVSYEAYRGLWANLKQFLLLKTKENPDYFTPVVNEVVNRYPVVYPRYYNGPIEYKKRELSDKETLSEILHVFNLKNTLSFFKLPLHNKDTFPFFEKWYRKYASGAVCVENNVPLDLHSESAFLEDQVGGF